MIGSKKEIVKKVMKKAMKKGSMKKDEKEPAMIGKLEASSPKLFKHLGKK